MSTKTGESYSSHARGVAARGDRVRARADREGLVRAQRAGRAVVRARPSRLRLRVRGLRRACAGLRPTRNQHHRAAAGRDDGDVPLGGRPGGLPRRGRRGAPDRRRRGAAAAAMGSRPLPAEGRAHDRRRGRRAVRDRRRRRARPLDRPRTGAATRSTRPPAATTPASRRRRRCRSRRTPTSGRRRRSATATASSRTEPDALLAGGARAARRSSPGAQSAHGRRSPRIVADAENAFDDGWADAPAGRDEPREDDDPLQDVYLGGAGVVDALQPPRAARLRRPAAGLRPLPRAVARRPAGLPGRGRRAEPLGARPGSGSSCSGSRPRRRTCERLAELIAANAQDERRELMWGSPGTILAGRELGLDVTARASMAPRRSGRTTASGHSGCTGRRSRCLGPAHGFAGCVLALGDGRPV